MLWNGKNAFGAEEGGVAGEGLAQIGSDEAGLPVVRVKNIGAKDISSDADGSLIQHRETKMIVG
jgi:hypothetical protein